jgi:hypothetical protein
MFITRPPDCNFPEHTHSAGLKVSQVTSLSVVDDVSVVVSVT